MPDMYRRTFISSVGVLGLSGCNADLGSEDTLPDVAIVTGWAGGIPSAWRRTSLRIEDGKVTSKITCARNAEPRTETMAVSNAEYEATQRLVAELNVSAWESHYECPSPCGAHHGGVRWIRLTIDGTTHETSIDPLADVPAGISRLLGHIDSYRRQVRDVGCKRQPSGTLERTESGRSEAIFEESHSAAGE